MDKDLAATIERLIDEAIRDAEVFLGILLRLVIDVQVQVLEVTVSLGVGLTGDIQDVRDSSLDELASLECALEGSHEDTSVDFEQDNVSQGLFGGNIASAEVHVREATTSDQFILAIVSGSGGFSLHPAFLVIDRNAAEARVTSHGLQL